MNELHHALIIEDDTSNSDILNELLKSESVICTIINDPRLVQSHMKEQAPPDVIFLDLEMPYIDGYEVLDLLKSDKNWEAVPVVACTVHVNEVQTARSKAFHSFIKKPFDMDAFPDQLLQILDDKPVWDISQLQ